MVKCKHCLNEYMYPAREENLVTYYVDNEWKISDHSVVRQYMKCDCCGFEITEDDAIIEDLYA